jgi:proline iminopeptidase
MRSAHVVFALLIVAACSTSRAQSPLRQPVVAVEEWDYVADDGSRQYVIELGRGDTVVVLHGGWGGEHSGLLEVVRPLSDRFHFVLYDQRGSMRSAAPDSTITVARLVRDLEGLRRQLGQERLVLLGHSMGAALAYAYLAQHPDRVRGLVLFAAVRPTEDALLDFGVPASDTARLAALRRALNGKQAARRAALFEAERLNRADTTSFTDREKTARWRIGLASLMLARPERWRRLAGGPRFYEPRVGEAIDRNTTRAQRDSLWRSFLPALDRFQGPLTVIAGDEDFIDPQAALWLHARARLPRLRLEILPGAGHLPWVDQPERLQALLRQGLERAVAR